MRQGREITTVFYDINKIEFYLERFKEKVKTNRTDEFIR